jgi:hypothetical protein
VAQGKLDRIQVGILAVSVLAAAGLGVWQGPLWAAGGFAGGLVGYLNFRWLRRTVERLLGDQGGKGRVAFVYSFKLAIVAAILAGLIWVAGVPAVAVLIGLGAMPLGIIAEMIWSLAVLPAEPEA